MDKLNIQEIPGYIMVHLLTVPDDRDCYSAVLADMIFVLNFTIYIYNKKVREASNIC
jgi:hypothetical protein